MNLPLTMPSAIFILLLCILLPSSAFQRANTTQNRRSLRPFKEPTRRYEIFVAGVEGAGHHGVVHGFLAPLISEVTGDDSKCAIVQEMPWFSRGMEHRAACHASTTIGWESFPSGRRLLSNERLSLLYHTPECFGMGRSKSEKKFPNNWRVALKEHDSCYRCGNDWRATLEDVSARHQISNRLNVTQLHQLKPQLRVIFLIREFSRAVFSHVHWDGGPRGHAMMMAVHQTALAEDAKAMKEGTWRVLHYESLIDDASYITTAIAAARFLGLAGNDLRPISEEVLTTFAKRIRKAAWHAPSSQHETESDAHSDIARHVREVEALMRHKWSIFDRVHVQLVPWNGKKEPIKTVQRRDLFGISPMNVSHDSPQRLTSTCPPPKYEPCQDRKRGQGFCSAEPFQNSHLRKDRKHPPTGVERWCIHEADKCF